MQLNDAIDVLVSSDCNLPLAAERLSKKTGEKVTEYTLTEMVTASEENSKVLVSKLRALLSIKLFDNIVQMQSELMGKLDEIPAKDLARVIASFITAFSTMTAPQAKMTFNFEDEIRKAAEEFNVEPEVIRSELKQLSVVK